jgi:outer membrane protein OmpA-like peptidoglycan-associated protein
VKTFRKFLAVAVAVPAIASALTVTAASAAVRPHVVPSVTATAGNGQANVMWSATPAPTNDYIYVVTSTPGNFTCETAQTSCIIQGLTNGTSYTFNVVDPDAPWVVWPTSNAVTPQGTPLTTAYHVTTTNVSGFASGKSTLTAAMKTTITGLATTIKNGNASKVAVAGHTDSVGNFATNSPLSVARARVAGAFLKSALNAISASNVSVSVSGHADRVPVATNTTAAGRALNRRVSFAVSTPYTVGKHDQTINAIVERDGGSYNDSVAFLANGDGGPVFASSTLTVTYHVEATSTALMCSVDANGVVSAESAGTCVVTALQTGDDNYNAAPGVQLEVMFAGDPQTINPATGSFTASVKESYNVSTTATSGLTVTYSVDPSSTATGCAVDENGNVTATTVGDCVINFDQSGNQYYSAADMIQATVTFTPPQQQQILTPNVLSGNKEGVSVATTATSGLPVAYEIYPGGTATNCAVDAEGLVTADTSGTCFVRLTQSGDTYWDSARPVVVTVTLNAPNGLTVHFVGNDQFPNAIDYICQVDAVTLGGFSIPSQSQSQEQSCNGYQGSDTAVIPGVTDSYSYGFTVRCPMVNFWVTEPTQQQIVNGTGTYTTGYFFSPSEMELPAPPHLTAVNGPGGAYTVITLPEGTTDLYVSCALGG